MIRVAINGFGRIGRLVTRLLIEQPDIQVVGINDIHPLETMLHLFKYDSVHGRWKGSAAISSGGFEINNKIIPYYNWMDPSEWDWKERPDIVLECTGLYKSKDEASLHIKAGARKVIISAPPDGPGVKTIVVGVNEGSLSNEDLVVSNASCTTNNAAPMIALLREITQIKSCYITTVHSYTGDQRLHDAPHRDLRRARAAACSIVPTTTGAAKALTKIFPDLDGFMGGCGIRVPVPDGSLTDITCVVEHSLSIEQINSHFKEAAAGRFKKVLEYTEDPIVSSDIIGNPYSCVFDGQLTSVIGNMVKVVGWYDNEMGYSNRLVDLIRLMA